MRDPCIRAVRSAIGRDITQAESKNIESRIDDAMRRLGREDPARWQTLSAEQRLREAADFAAKDLVHEAQKKKQRIASSIVAHDRVDNYTAAQVTAKRDKTRLDALDRTLVGKNDGKNNFLSVETQFDGNFHTSLGRMVEAFEAIHPRWLGLFQDKRAEHALRLALEGDKTQIPEIQKAAEVIHNQFDLDRQRLNAGGADVGKLENYSPHSWSADQFIRAGHALAERARAHLPSKLGKALNVEKAREAVVDFFLPRVKRDLYRHADGRAFSDGEMKQYLSDFFDSVTTNGANKEKPTTQPGGSMVANRHAQERHIHFTDPTSAVEALEKFGDKNLYQVLVDHTRSMARDTALLETFGANADATFEHLLEKYRRESVMEDRTKEKEIDGSAARIMRVYKHLAGEGGAPIENRKVAAVMAGVRDLLTSNLLGASSVTAWFGDKGTLMTTAMANHLPPVKMFMNTVRAFNPFDRSEKERARVAGLLVENIIDEVNRFSNEAVGPRATAKMASAVIRATGLNSTDGAHRRALKISLMDQIGGMTRRIDSFDKLQESDASMLKQSGITDKEWQIYRMATPDKWRGNDHVLTTESIFNIHDEKMRQALAPQLKEMRYKAAQNISELKQRIDKESGWQKGRIDKFDEMVKRRESELSQFSMNREQWSAHDRTRFKLLDRYSKQIESEARAEAEVTKAFQEAAIQGNLRELLIAVDEGTSPEKIAEKTLPGLAKQIESRAVKTGRELGRKLAEEKAKVAVAREKLNAAKREYKSEVNEKQKAIDDFINQKSDELDQFIGASSARQDRFKLAMEGVQKRLTKEEESLIPLSRQQAASALMGFLVEQQNLAIPVPSARQRAPLTQGAPKGSYAGELNQAMHLFKSFPFSFFQKHMIEATGRFESTAGKIGYVASFVALQTILGAIALEVTDVVRGRNPRALGGGDHLMRNWLAAMVKGGGLGAYGDFLFNDTTTGGNGVTAQIAGPVAGMAEDLDKATRGNMLKMANGQKTAFGSDMVKFGSRYLVPKPWYTQAALNHLVFDQMQEYFSPGYLARAQTHSRNLYGTSYWWRPGAPFSQAEAPDLGTIMKEK